MPNTTFTDFTENTIKSYLRVIWVVDFQRNDSVYMAQSNLISLNLIPGKFIYGGSGLPMFQCVSLLLSNFLKVKNRVRVDL